MMKNIAISYLNKNSRNGIYSVAPICPGMELINLNHTTETRNDRKNTENDKALIQEVSVPNNEIEMKKGKIQKIRTGKANAVISGISV